MPNANALDGFGSNGFIQGSGRIITLDTATPNSTVLFDLAGFVKMFGNCGGTASPGNYSVTTHGHR